MFSQLSERLNRTLGQLTGRGKLTEKNIKNSLREVRVALLEADVALPIVKGLIKNISQEALGQRVTKSLNPGQTFIKIVSEHLTDLLGDRDNSLRLNVKRPVVILLAGLQGAGKTTTAGKLAKWLQEQQKMKVMLTSTDVHRPAAIDQLATLCEQVGATWHPSETTQQPATIAQSAKQSALQLGMDALIVDTAGRTHIDEAMMHEVKTIQNTVQPTETLFVADSMAGQDAVNAAKSFHDALTLTGVILTKTDGDARGGAALSIKSITDQPIKFVGTGEKIDGLEAFHPERVAQRILGMGDMLSFIEETERKIQQQQSEQTSKKIRRGSNLNLNDFLSQLKQMKAMGGLSSLMSKMPNMPQNNPINIDSNQQMLCRMQAIIESMTPQERRDPDCLKSSRKQRIARGSGTQVQDINRLLKQFKNMQKMMKKMKGGKLNQMMQNMPSAPPVTGLPQ